jgi:hypothetical protein
MRTLQPLAHLRLNGFDQRHAASTTRWIVVALAALLAANTAYAANVVVEKPETPTSPAVVSVTGHIDQGDTNAFVAVTHNMQKATIYFFSPGGAVRDGIAIGLFIRRKSFTTAVVDGQTCWSACALAWLGGAKRFLGNSAAVGFHAPYRKTKTTRQGDAKGAEMVRQRDAKGAEMVSQYLKRVNLPDRVAAYVLEAGPDQLNLLLSDDDGRTHGIELTKLPIREFIPLP